MGANPAPPNLWLTLPFGALLATMAVAPLLCAGWWQRHYPKVAGGLGAFTLGYYLLRLHAYDRVLHTGADYLSFMALIASLFITAGGIHLRVPSQATPLRNTGFLFVGALAANVMGSIGASVLLIGPWLRMNRPRAAAHHVVFFIFIIANVGGCLTPIGNPPLFLGYLKGIPFWWVTQACGAIWLFGVALLLVMFYLIDRHRYWRASKPATPDPSAAGSWELQGTGNLVFLALAVIAVFLQRPPLAREALMLGAALGSYFTTRPSIHAANDFSFHPLIEVAVLFAGVFATMLPALQWLEWHAAHSTGLGPTFFYWSTGALSSVLDNAPTYLGSLSAILAATVNPDLVAQVQQFLAPGDPHGSALSLPARQIVLALQQYHGTPLAAHRIGTADIQLAGLLSDPFGRQCLVAVSVGAVFFGAATYLGNGPNFLIKAVAEHQKVPTPGFLEFIVKYTLPCLLPMLLVVWWLFIRG